MAFCSKCGKEVGGALFCPSCGAPQGSVPVPPATGVPVAGATSGLDENVAAALSYSLGWVTGLIFYFIDKRPFVRFHAAQSIVVFAGLHIATVILGMIFGFGFGFGGWGGFGLGFGLYHLLQIVGLVAWVLCMIKAFQHERFKLPIAGDIAEGLASK